MSDMRWYTTIGILVLVISSGCVTQDPQQFTRVALGDATLLVEIADSSEERAAGLMHRASLPKGQGMLFIFEEEQEVSFWMKNTLIPLDIIYINSSGHVTKILGSVPPCEADPCPTYPSEGNVKYVLEVNAGWAERNSISIGQFFEMEYMSRET